MSANEKDTAVDMCTTLLNASDNLYILWLALEEDKVERVQLSNALQAVYQQIKTAAMVVNYYVNECEVEGE